MSEFEIDKEDGAISYNHQHCASDLRVRFDEDTGAATINLGNYPALSKTLKASLENLKASNTSPFSETYTNGREILDAVLYAENVPAAFKTIFTSHDGLATPRVEQITFGRNGNLSIQMEEGQKLSTGHLAQVVIGANACERIDPEITADFLKQLYKHKVLAEGAHDEFMDELEPSIKFQHLHHSRGVDLGMVITMNDFEDTEIEILLPDNGVKAQVRLKPIYGTYKNNDKAAIKSLNIKMEKLTTILQQQLGEENINRDLSPYKIHEYKSMDDFTIRAQNVIEVNVDDASKIIKALGKPMKDPESGYEMGKPILPKDVEVLAQQAYKSLQLPVQELSDVASVEETKAARKDVKGSATKS